MSSADERREEHEAADERREDPEADAPEPTPSHTGGQAEGDRAEHEDEEAVKRPTEKKRPSQAEG